jgi:hypothetical protein
MQACAKGQHATCAIIAWTLRKIFAGSATNSATYGRLIQVCALHQCAAMMPLISTSHQSIHIGITGHLCIVANGRGGIKGYIALQQSEAKVMTFADASILRRRHTMVAVTYSVARVPANKSAERTQATAPGKSLFARFMDALVESRLQHVHREIARHAHLLPHTFDEKGKRLVKPNIDEMPFGGW